MFKLFSRPGNTGEITCPNCLVEQTIPPKALSIFCKNCRTRIDINYLRQKSSLKGANQTWKPKTKTISCPYCHSLQDVLATALSSYCKNCHQRITIGENIKTELNEPVITETQREVTCPHCGMLQKVPSTALSSFCTECGNRINLQNYEIKGRFRGNLETKGTIYISDEGYVEGNINTGSAIIAGKFKGEIIAEEIVEIRPSAKLYGKIRSPALEASSGAVFVGHLHIGK